MNLNAVADSGFIDAVAVDLGIPTALVEKDWYVVQVLRVIAGHTELAGHVSVFGGGTSLSKGFGIIKRLSEDIDFKVIAPEAASKSARSKGFSDCRKAILDALRQQGFTWDDKTLLVGKNSAFFQALLTYPREFPMPYGFRPELKIEVTFEPPRLATVGRPISSFVSIGKRLDPEVSMIACVDPLEIAADKVSAFAWRAKAMLDAAKRAEARGRDGTLVRHLHDLAALEPRIVEAAGFAASARALMEKDIVRAKATGADLAAILTEVGTSLESNPVWRREYDSFVRHLSYAADDERIAYDAALSCWIRLAKHLLNTSDY